MKPLQHLLPFFLLLPGAIIAQTAEPLGADIPFFQRQANVYQQWLEQSGLGAALRVEQVEVRADTQFILYLGFYTEDPDTALARWEQLRVDLRALDTGDSLEKALFDRMTYLMSVPPKQGEIRLFNTYDRSQTPCFARRIHLQDGRLRTAAKFCKSEERKITVNACNIKKDGRPMSAKAFQKQFAKDSVFQRLIPYLTQKYTRSRCDGRNPTIIFHNTSDELHFEVRDLCKEILTDEENPWWCEALGYLSGSNVNCIKRERLVGHITYEKDPSGTGFVLKTKIDGAFGSGWYDKPRDNGYHDIQAQYPGDLRRYADKLNEDIRQFLL
ncbi:MAG: hypothetical protein SFV52_01745 [Saprospiraceae bacterium]|nr:hypothetical protein [Saprospiraceae bacterium]